MAKKTIRTYVGDGSTTIYPIDFTLGYINKDYVYVYMTSESYTTQLSYTWLNSTQIGLTEPVAVGVEFSIRRVVPRGTLVNDYEDGAILRESNLDASFKQTLMIQEEIADGFFTVGLNAALMNTDLDMQGFRLTNLPKATDPTDPVRQQEFEASLTEQLESLNLNKEYSYPLGAGQTLVSVALDASNSSFYVSTPNSLGGKLVLNTDYVVVSSSQIQLLNTFPTGSVITENGIAIEQTVVDREATAITKYIKAEDFGFTHINTGLDNLTALTAAYNACPSGGIITINQDEDFLCNKLDVVDGKDFGIEINGVGKWQLGVSRAVTILNSFTDLKVISNIALVSLTVNGSPVNVTELTVPNEWNYIKGDVVKVFSDDLDTYDGRPNRRRGEFAEVIATDVGKIYLTCGLEDVYDTNNNARVARMNKNSFSFKGKLISNLGNTSEVVQLEGIYKPRIEIDVENHGKIVVNHKSSFLGNFYLSGSGFADNSGSLGYLANDSAGYHNVYHAPFGKFFRHVVTSNATSVAPATDSPEDYGPTRGMTVRDGVSIGAQGAAFDDHDGARRSQFINCKSLNPMRSSAAYPCTFQIRGRDTKIIGGETVGPTQTTGDDYAHIRFGTTASGHIQIDHTTCTTAIAGLLFIKPPTANARGKLSVTVNGGNVRLNSAQTLVYVNWMDLQLNGTNFVSEGVTTGFTQNFDVADATLYLNNVKVRVEGTGTSARAVRLSDNAKVVGSMFLDVDGVSYASGVLSEGTGNSSYLTLVNAGGAAGSLNDSGTFDFISNTLVAL
tara:strand:- start:8084 stop:10438 length:2355 start_codon:yes stop_codon:yes gene_type:complete